MKRIIRTRPRPKPVPPLLEEQKTWPDWYPGGR